LCLSWFLFGFFLWFLFGLFFFGSFLWFLLNRLGLGIGLLLLSGWGVETGGHLWPLPPVFLTRSDGEVTRRLRGRFVMLTQITMHLIECSPRHTVSRLIGINWPNSLTEKSFQYYCHVKAVPQSCSFIL